ncbi:hypothetical protein EGN69_14705 [Pseudomonas monteilii]|nr:hypothetical protein EGN69_14705 [Pseudomonas monteilii]
MDAAVEEDLRQAFLSAQGIKMSGLGSRCYVDGEGHQGADSRRQLDRLFDSWIVSIFVGCKDKQATDFHDLHLLAESAWHTVGLLRSVRRLSMQAHARRGLIFIKSPWVASNPWSDRPLTFVGPLT